MDVITYALCKKLVAATASGISNIEVVGSDLVFTTSSGEQLTVTLPLPESNVSIVDIIIDKKTNHLLYVMSDDTVVDIGALPAGGEVTDEQVETITQEVYNLLEEYYLSTFTTNVSLFAGADNLGTPDNPAEGTILAELKKEIEESSQLEII
jgi:hypothetical protein